MVMQATSFSGSGLRDWLWQRLTALYMLFYLIAALGYLIISSPLDYAFWHMVLSFRVVRVTSLLFLLSIIIHGWIGMWTVATDYFKWAKGRQLFYAIMVFYFGGCLLWGIEVLWRIG